jgi:hypothetical protein
VVELLIVVQAVAGSNPVTHPILSPRRNRNKHMKIQRLIFIFLLAAIFLPCPARYSFGEIIDKISGIQIAVEKLTGRGEEYEVDFSGWVGSLRVDLDEKLILISEFSNIDGIVVVNGIYKIVKIDEYDKSLDFECFDLNSLTKGIEWRGKIWLTDSNEIKIEMVQKQSSRKWVNLSEYGKRFLKNNGLEKLYLGN